MNNSITFSTRTHFEFTFGEFFEIYFYNDQRRHSYASRVWQKMIDQIGGTECEFTDEVGFHDFISVINGLKIDAESDTYETDSDEENEEKKQQTDSENEEKRQQTDSDNDY